jgi:hypothetical protein
MESIWQALFGWAVLGTVVAVLIGIGFGVLSMTPPDFTIARICFSLAAGILSIKTAIWLVQLQAGRWERIGAAVLIFGIIGGAWVWSQSWIDYRDEQRRVTANPPQVVTSANEQTNQNQTPSLVFVFGAPLGDNDSAQWIMVLKHFGPSLAHRCDIVFNDDDRKNIEHEWLVKHPNIPYPPPELVGVSGKRIFVPEAGPEGSLGSFKWNPVNPNSQHYTASIDCRDGYFVEKWQISRINGILRSSITIEHGSQWVTKNPGLDPIVFKYQDPEFMQTALATEMPKVQQGKVVHPGWKPSHRFEVPAAIIDPNGNMQVVGGVKLPDGSMQTDFGSWNILTKHFGDEKK